MGLVIFFGIVYLSFDCFLVPQHPGADYICVGGGKDATEKFEELGHSSSAKSLALKYYCIGTIEGEEESA